MKNEIELTDFDKNMLNTSVSWGGTSTGREAEGVCIGDISVDYGYYHENWYPHSHWYPYNPIEHRFVTIKEESDKTKQAFRIVKLLMKKKLAKVDKVKDFVELIDEILEIL